MPRNALVSNILILALICLVAPVRAEDTKSEGEPIFNGKDLSGWKYVRDKDKEMWSVVASVKLDPNNPKRLIGSGTPTDGNGILFRDGEGDSGGQKGTDIYTEKMFRDCEVHAEFMTPADSNSGVYLMGQYEIQIWTDIGKPVGMHGTGAVYVTKPPTVIALKPYGEWNTYDIVFKAPRFDASGKKIKNAVVMSVILNGVKVQPEPVDTPKPTGGTLKGNAEAPTGPIMLQGNHGPVAFRNVRVKPIELKD
ncbi:MAG TPA: DUF1080 domain-containing protein [Humisphaera sp.]|jgi:hypothetical protein|nr:DUF1080 domain-containing protein [Humisphaera sp.]